MTEPESVDTIKMLERVAKLEERVDGGFVYLNKELKEIKDNHLHQLQSDVSDLKVKVNTLAVKVSIAASIAMILVDLAIRFFFK
jgi:hypothetical protein